jgi:tartrate dehydratase alpha subunit/fumarate hydratase class I-like protein
MAFNSGEPLLLTDHGVDVATAWFHIANLPVCMCVSRMQHRVNLMLSFNVPLNV